MIARASASHVLHGALASWLGCFFETIQARALLPSSSKIFKPSMTAQMTNTVISQFGMTMIVVSLMACSLVVLSNSHAQDTKHRKIVLQCCPLPTSFRCGQAQTLICRGYTPRWRFCMSCVSQSSSKVFSFVVAPLWCYAVGGFDGSGPDSPLICSPSCII